MDLIDNQETVFIGSSEQMFLREIGKFPVLSPEEEKELFIRYKNGDLSAKEELILKNLKLVAAIAYKMPKSNLEVIDKIQEGVFGLKKAIDRYDVNLGYKFSTYATWWIHQEIYRSVKKNKKVVSVSINMEEKLVRYRKAAHELTKTLGRKPTDNELAKRLKVSVEEVISYHNFNEKEVSLNKTIGFESDEELGNFIKDENSAFEEDVIKKITNQSMINLINSLNVPQAYKIMVFLRFGFYDNQEYTLLSIAKYFGLTKQRVEQIINYMKNKILRHHNFNKDYLNNHNTGMIINSLELYDFFANGSDEDIIKAISALSVKEKKYLYSKFGPNLDLETTVDQEDLDIELGETIKKIKSIMYKQKKSAKALLKKLK